MVFFKIRFVSVFNELVTNLSDLNTEANGLW